MKPLVIGDYSNHAGQVDKTKTRCTPIMV